MFSSNRRADAVLIAVIAICLGVLLFLVWEASAEKAYQRAYAQYQTDARNEGAKDEDCSLRTSFPSMRECIIGQEDATRENKASEYDLAAQEEMAYWTPWIFIGSIISAFLTLVGVVYVRLTLLETRRIGQAQVRAYLEFIPKIATIDTPPNGNMAFGISGVVKVIGGSPARNIKAGFWMGDIPIDGEIPPSTVQMKQLRNYVAPSVEMENIAIKAAISNFPINITNADGIWFAVFFEWVDVFSEIQHAVFRYQPCGKDGKPIRGSNIISAYGTGSVYVSNS